VATLKGDKGAPQNQVVYLHKHFFLGYCKRQGQKKINTCGLIKLKHFKP
jgi:hypothetical protein